MRGNGRLPRAVALAAPFLLLLLAFQGVAQAAVITVTTIEDELNSDGDCSLREAIQAANTDSAVDACVAGSGADVINLPGGSYYLTIPGAGEDNNQTGDLDINSDITINGSGVGATVISGNDVDRVLDIVSGTFNISGVTITNGGGGWPGGGIYNQGTLNISESTISGNETGDFGAGINNAGTMTINNTTVSGNHVGGPGGGIFNLYSGTLTINNTTISANTSPQTGAGISNDGTLTINNSTVSGNDAGSSGGGISNSGTLTINNTTISSNTAGTLFGGGIRIFSGAVNIKNSILAGNSTSGTGPDCSGTLTSQGYNVVQDTSGCTISGDTTGNVTGQDPLLGPLQNNGGPTFTHTLLSGSPAIDAGNPAAPGSGGPACEATDQRGVARPQGSRCDIGAFELVQAVPTPTPTKTPAPPTPTPTLVPGVAAPELVVMAGLLAASGFWAIRRRRRRIGV